jgi:hypothetical protein
MNPKKESSTILYDPPVPDLGKYTIDKLATP